MNKTCIHTFVMSDFQRNVWSSSLATLTAEIVTLPICTTKTVYQSGLLNEHKERRPFRSIFSWRHPSDPQSAVGFIWQQNGWKGFYKASVPAVAAQVFATTSKYSLYQAFQNKNQHQTKSPDSFGFTLMARKMMIGLVTGTLVSVVTHPIDVCRIVLQNQQSIQTQLKSSPSWHQFFYRGYSKTLLKIGIGSAAFFPIYDLCKHHIESPFYSAFTSSVLSTCIMHPADYLKTIYAAGVKTPLTLDVLKKSYRGVTLNLMRIVPHFTIVMTCTEMLKNQLK